MYVDCFGVSEPMLKIVLLEVTDDIAFAKIRRCMFLWFWSKYKTKHERKDVLEPQFHDCCETIALVLSLNKQTKDR